MLNGNKRYYFEFVIKLHIDDAPLLKTILNTLGIGRLAERPNSNTCSFEVGSEKDLRILISILDKTTLMGSKYLDYLSFRKAFFLYFERSGVITEALIAEIEKIRSNHNTKRTEFTMPADFKCAITDYKLLGLIEGDGSFVIQKQGLTPRFELELTSSQKPLLLAIQDYLISNLGFDRTYLENFRFPPIRVRDVKAKSNGKAGVRLEVAGVDLLNNYFNGFLSKLTFLSAKGKDFEKFKFICKTLHSKAHINNPELKDLLLEQASGMNSARLSTNKRKEIE